MACLKSACSAFWTTRKIGYIIYLCDGFSKECWDAMQCPVHIISDINLAVYLTL